MSTIQLHTIQKDHYGVKLFFAFSLLLLVLASTSLYLIENYFSKSFFNFSNTKTIYFLDSNNVKKMYEKYQMDFNAYTSRIEAFKKMSSDLGFNTKTIQSNRLNEIPKNSLLVLLDTTSLSNQEINTIESFVNSGGKLLFNYTSGFLDTHLSYRERSLVNLITGFELDPNINLIKPDSKSGVFLTVKLTSPLAKYLSNGRGISLNIYDPFPVYRDPNTKNKTDGYLTNWTQTKYINLTKSQELNKQQSAILWHGHKGKGKWVYFSFPSSGFLDTQKEYFKDLYKGMLEYLYNVATVIPYPYVDADNIVFVSEDTEFKFENLQNFATISKKHSFPVTAFCVASIAEKHKNIVYNASKSPYMEIGSHSYSHTKITNSSDAKYKKETIGSKEILENITHKKIYGFRAPREEIDKKLIKDLIDGGYTYILNENDNLLYPYFQDGILIIPRHGTDDYSYLINLDWSANEILENMIKEVEITTSLNGLFTLSTHTHLMNYGDNIKILEQFFQYINAHQKYKPMNGKMIYKRIFQKKNLYIDTKFTSKKIILTINNDTKTSIEDLHIIIETDPNMKLNIIESEIIGIQATLAKQNKGKYLVTINSLQPNSQSVFFINYVQNN